MLLFHQILSDQYLSRSEGQASRKISHKLHWISKGILNRPINECEITIISYFLNNPVFQLYIYFVRYILAKKDFLIIRISINCVLKKVNTQDKKKRCQSKMNTNFLHRILPSVSVYKFLLRLSTSLFPNFRFLYIKTFFIWWQLLWV